MDDSSYHVINLFQIGESHHTVDCSPRVTALGDSEEHDNARRDSRVRSTLKLSHWQGRTATQSLNRARYNCATHALSLI